MVPYISESWGIANEAKCRKNKRSYVYTRWINFHFSENTIHTNNLFSLNYPQIVALPKVVSQVSQPENVSQWSPEHRHFSYLALQGTWLPLIFIFKNIYFSGLSSFVLFILKSSIPLPFHVAQWFRHSTYALDEESQFVALKNMFASSKSSSSRLNYPQIVSHPKVLIPSLNSSWMRELPPRSPASGIFSGLPVPDEQRSTLTI